MCPNRGTDIFHIEFIIQHDYIEEIIQKKTDLNNIKDLVLYTTHRMPISFFTVTRYYIAITGV